jgi:hypothetical protein
MIFFFLFKGNLFLILIKHYHEQGKEKSISFDLKQTEKYVAGNYGIMVYQNGFKIGEGIAILK